jgi:hypothetical protein
VTADAATTLAWIAVDPPEPQRARALSGWARAHGVTLAPPTVERLPALAVDPRVADQVETLLDRARDALAARDGDGVDRALSAAESALRAHPELPQAAWLMAEVERARSTRFRRLAPADDEAAERAWARAEAIDGGRGAGLGEVAGKLRAAAASVALEMTPRDIVSPAGTPFGRAAESTVLVDGLAARAVVATREGLHTIVVLRDGAPLWATWFETPAGTSTLRVSAPAAPACSSEDVGRARIAAGRVEADGIRCTTWAAALPGGEEDSVLVAACERGRCGPLLEWRAPQSWTWEPPPEPSRHAWPTWATWSLVGAGAAIATGVVLVAAGVFQSAPTESRFTSGGVKVQ